MGDMHLLELINITKNYKNVRAVESVSFYIDRSEIFALLGPNGAGKTTIIRIIGEGLAHQGKLLMEGKKIERWKIGYAPQEGLLYRDLTAQDNIKFYALVKKVSIKESIKILKDLEIPNKKVRELSGGMQRRLSIAIALLGNPKLLVLDEPTVGLDVESRREIWKIIKKNREEGRAILLTTHYMDEAEKLADRIAIINEGRIIAIDSPEKLKKMAGMKSSIIIKGNFRKIPSDFVREEEKLIKFSQNPREELPELVETLSKSGEIKEIFVREPTLEDVFLKFTGRGLGE